ncbi:hypothetical protein [Thalassomonas actiniarum]|uniref:Uncharacterized protein n=1 Tax=Thalassomonas actiniarum TaxID=485447 RepID=A0AAE9YS03_9GAMM|nr:hypothetical protein [Thalassomonas actiniarum]WDD99373.1 hypothetical protein SG35_001395 [Thalassomonas actiniarum]
MNWTYAGKITIMMFICLLCSCSGEYRQAIKAYEQARADNQLQPLVQALKTLSRLDPEQYQQQFSLASQAQQQYQQAQASLAQGDYLAAYLASHASYRALTTETNKALLIASGKALVPLMRAQGEIKRSYLALPESMGEMLQAYASREVENWQQLALNTLLGQLTRGILALENAVKIIHEHKLEALDPAISSWSTGINSRLALLTGVRDYLVGEVRYLSASKLLELNLVLAKESASLLSYVRDEVAQKTLYPVFFKAQQKYRPYGELLENVSLALSLSQRDIHAPWYQHWQALADEVLQQQQPFSRYPQLADKRSRQIKALIAKNKRQAPEWGVGLADITSFNHEYPKISELVDKLNQDKTLLYLGSPG